MDIVLVISSPLTPHEPVVQNRRSSTNTAKRTSLGRVRSHHIPLPDPHIMAKATNQRAPRPTRLRISSSGSAQCRPIRVRHPLPIPPFPGRLPVIPDIQWIGRRKTSLPRLASRDIDGQCRLSYPVDLEGRRTAMTKTNNHVLKRLNS